MQHSRIETEVAQLALVTLSGVSAYYGPRQLTFSASTLPLAFVLFYGVFYGMDQEVTMNFDRNVKHKEIAMKAIRSVLAISFGATLGGIPRVFSDENIGFPGMWGFTAILSGGLFPFTTFLDWFVQAKPYKG